MTKAKSKPESTAKRETARSQLKIVIVGHVDHGKSTLVGRLLHDTHSLPNGKEEAIRASCAKRGMNFEWSFLMDALQTERDQGITIDTTQIWLRTKKRDVVIIDAPGHKEFLKNMITGAAQADAALALIDAKEGIREQSKRHGYLLHLLGVRQIAVLVNKMDSVGYDQKVFKKIEREYSAYLKSVGVKATCFIPISAREGDSITGKSAAMKWYKGPSVLAALDGFKTARADEKQSLRFPIQDVYKFDERRILAGRIESGSLKVGDTLLFSPTGAKAKVVGIETWPQKTKPKKAVAGQSIGITLDEPIFVERGHVASDEDAPPAIVNQFRARIFWLGKKPLEAGGRYKLKIGTSELQAEVKAIEHVIDSDTLKEVKLDKVERGNVAEVIFRARGVIAVDPYEANARTGRFVIVEDYDVAGGGVIGGEGLVDQRAARSASVKSKNIFDVDFGVTPESRALANGHLGGALWFTGLSGSGKSTIAKQLQKRLFDKGYHVFALDGDNVRQGLNRDLGFSPKDRSENIRRAGEVAALFAQAGTIVITSFISPYREDRRSVRAIAPDLFHNIYIKASLKTCEKRDSKGLYKKARAGKIPEFTGVSAPYEEPENPDIVVDTESMNLNECVEQLVKYVEKHLVEPALNVGGDFQGNGHLMERFGFDIAFEELYDCDGLSKVDAAFVGELKSSDVALFNRFMAARADKNALSDKDHSQLLLDLAPHVEDFIGKLFGVEKELRALAEKHYQLAPLYACKRLFVQRRASKALKPEEAERVSGDALLDMLPLVPADDPLFELVFAKVIMGWLEKEEEHKALIEIAARYAAWALYSEAGRTRHGKGILFKQPKKLDPEHLIEVETEERGGVQVLRLPKSHLRARDGFKLTDDKGTLAQALDQAHYCIFCAHQGKDSCSKGMKEKTGEYKKNTLEITLAGCPLEEKISEMNELKAAGVPLGALAVVVVDNPMCAGTGHRICNDCMKSCIYQKQEPVNIPLVETHVLQDALNLPYGFEIYSLLTRWNPLNLARPIPKEESGYKVLVAGLGPAGYTLSHHLMNDGHMVVGIDGLKIEPVAPEISGVTPLGERASFQPIKDIKTLYESLDERSLAGFGGVAEYGITVRWDKNYLKVIRLLLERRAQFSMIGGVRFGSSLTYENAHALGFDHIALCMGAGKPTMIEMKNGVARGVRAASDFLMALQLTGAAKKDSIANLQLRLPVVVIGGGLTAIDTATESLAYYPQQVEKFLARYEALVSERGEKTVRASWSEEDAIIAEEFISHARAIREEKKKPKPDVWSLLDKWGGVKLVYRKRLIDAPSYRLNHEEVEKAFEEGIFFSELFEPAGVELDRFGHAESITLRKAGTEQTISLPARAILVAAGTNPNTVLEREDPAHFELDGKYFKAVDDEGKPVKPERVAKPNDVRVLMSLADKGCSASFFGDLHPSFAGNVVKAMGGAKQGYPVVTRVLEKKAPQSPVASEKFISHINQQLRASVHQVNRLTSTIVEVVVKAPLAAERFEPGQFYRLQNFEANAARIGGATLAMEGLAMTGAWVDKKQGLISVIILEMGGSSDLCAHLKIGEPVILMGPTGTPTDIPEKETVMLVGGGLGNAVLFSIGKALREKGSKVLYFAGYRKLADRYKVEEIERASDEIIWCCDEGEFAPDRAQDKSFHGNIVEAIKAYGAGALGDGKIKLSDVTRIIVIGSDRMMAAVAEARWGALRDYLNPKHIAIGSINSPMQCMMKEICAQCLQKHVDPHSGKESYVYSCFNQDQPLDSVSWAHLHERLKQNSVQEKMTALWIDSCLKRLRLRIAA